MQSVIHLTSGTYDLFPPVYAVQNDTGRTLKMIVDDVTYTSSYSGELYFRRSDGSYYNVATTFSSTDNSFEADITQALTQPGHTKCQLKVEDTNGDVVSTFTFVIVVQLSTDGVPSEQLGVSPEDLMEAAAQLTLSDNDVKLALLQIAEKVVYIDPDGQQYYDDLYDALYPPVRATSVTLNKNSLVFGGVGGTDTLVATVSPNNVEDDTVYWGSSDKDVAVVSDGIVTAVGVGSCTITATCGTKHDSAAVTVAAASLSSISATYTQTDTVYPTTPLDDLKTDLVVTATWSDSTQTTVPSTDYTLSGTLAVGSSTVTVTYGGKTDTFSVSVSQPSRLPEGYTEYEYIQLNAQYRTIVTAATITSGYTITTCFGYETTTASNAVPIMGTRVGGSGTKQIGLFATPSSGKLGYWYGGTDTTTNITALSGGGAKNTVVIKPVGADNTYPNNATITLNGTVYNTGSTATGETWSSWFGFFGYAKDATSGNGGVNTKAMIGETVVTDSSNNTIYDFIPCYSGTYYGFYESVNEVFYADTGSASSYSGGNWS